jgi:hypothetical protein
MKQEDRQQALHVPQGTFMTRFPRNAFLMLRSQTANDPACKRVLLLFLVAIFIY